MNSRELVVFIEVAADGITNIFFKAGKIITLSEDRLAECARRVASLGCFFDKENELAHCAILPAAATYAPACRH